MLRSPGATVWIFDLAREDPERVAAAFDSKGAIVDVSDRASIQTAFDRLDTVDVVVANAGAVTFAPFSETTAEDW